MSDWIRKIIKNIQLTLTEPSAQMSRWQKTLRFSWDASRHCTRELKHDKAPQMAAALTYHTLFSLMPTLVLALVVMQAFVGGEDREKFKLTVVDLVLSPITEDTNDTVELRIEVDSKGEVKTTTPKDKKNNSPENKTNTQPNTKPETEPDNKTDTIKSDKEKALIEANAKRSEFERARLQLENNLQSVINALEQINFKSIGLVGILIFIYGATGLLATIEKSFNAIFGVEGGRSWYTRLPLYYTVITLGPIVMLAGIWMQQQFFTIMESVSWLKFLVGGMGAIMPILTTWLVLMLLFLLLPTAKVSRRSAAIGSLVSALGWGVAAKLFSIYAQTAAISTLYGALALLPLFLMWIWLTWLIILFGLELTYTLQSMKGQQFKSDDGSTENRVLIDQTWLTVVAGKLADLFSRGETMNVFNLSESLNLPVRILEPMLHALTNNNIAHQVIIKEEEQYTLARPADKIPMTEILDVSKKLQPTILKDKSKAWAFVDHTNKTLRAESENQTLADLCG